MVSLTFVQVTVLLAALVVQMSVCLLQYPLLLLRDSLETHLILSPTDYDFLENSLKIPLAVSQLWLARYADSCVPRKLVALSLLISGSVMFFFGKIDNYEALVFMLIISGVFQGLVWPSICKLLFFWYQDSKLNTYFGFLSLADYLANIIANFLVLFLLSKYSWREVYLPFSTIAIFVSFLAFLSLYLPHEVQIAVPERNEYKKMFYRIPWKQIWNMPGVSDLSLAVCCLKLVKSAMIFWIPDFLAQKAGYSEYRTQIALTIYKISNLFGCIGVGLTARKETVLIQSLILVGVGVLGFVTFWATLSWSHIWNLHVLAIAGFAIGGPAGALSSSFAVSVGELDGRKLGGAVVGVVNGFGTLGEILEQVVVSFVVETHGWNSFLVLLINILCFSAFSINRAHSAIQPKLTGSSQYVI